jgi:hypothetical protein
MTPALRPQVCIEQPIPVTTEIALGGQFSGRIVWIAPKVGPQARRLAIQATVSNPDGALQR